MKVTKTPSFSPVTIVLETEEEYNTLIKVFQNSFSYAYSTTNYLRDIRPPLEKVMFGQLEDARNKTF